MFRFIARLLGSSGNWLCAKPNYYIVAIYTSCVIHPFLTMYEELVGSDLTQGEIRNLDMALNILLNEQVTDGTRRECFYCIKSVTETLLNGVKYLYNTCAMLKLARELECDVVDRQEKIRFLERKKSNLFFFTSAYIARTRDICSACRSGTARAIAGWTSASLLQRGWWDEL